MPQVRILKSLGFEQPGDVVDYRGVDLSERIAAGDLELITPEAVPSEAPIEEVTQEVIPEPTPTEEPIVETPEEKIEKLEEEVQEVKAEVEGN